VQPELKLKVVTTIRLKATTTTVLSEEIAKIYIDKIWKIHGIPKKILSDRESQFTS